MSRRRRRHQDPALAPRKPRQERVAKDERRKATSELERVHGSLARTTSLMGAAVVYFGVWTANAAFGLFPLPQSFDLSNPQLVVGLTVIVLSYWVSGWLTRSVPTPSLVRYAIVTMGALGLVLATFVGLFAAASAAPSGELAFLVAAIVVSWGLALVWVVVLSRRARALAGRSGPTEVLPG